MLDNDTDVDSVLNVTNAAALSGTGTYGSLAIDTLGSWTYTLDSTNPAVQALNDGDTLTETYIYNADGQSASLVITINGATDGGLVNLTGVWELTFTHVSETGPGCPEPGTTPGAEETLITSFVQSGTSITAVKSGGGLMTGTIDQVTGVFSVSGTDSVEKINLFDLTDLVPIVETSTISIAATGSDAGTMTSGDTVTIVDNPGTANECTLTKSLSGQHLYTHTGSEDYNGVHAFEILFTGYGQTGPYPSEQESFTLEMAITGSNLEVHIAEYPGETNTITATSFDPTTGLFQFTLEGKAKYDEDGDTIIDQSETHKSVISGILVGDPTFSKGGDGAPLGSFIERGYEREFSGDVDAGGTVISASNYASHGYGKLLTTAAFSRTQRIRTKDQKDEVQIKLGVNNTPLRRSSASSKLYLQVTDEASTVLCTVPYSLMVHRRVDLLIRSNNLILIWT